MIRAVGPLLVVRSHSKATNGPHPSEATGGAAQRS